MKTNNPKVLRALLKRQKRMTECWQNNYRAMQKEKLAQYRIAERLRAKLHANG